mmetsp:Transcript_29453/g.56961  ORF Transcript_29453/g.56961 Transcript_29453/m.56961 type:complete len:213 (-) Transcript_29453:120-758(-)
MIQKLKKVAELLWSDPTQGDGETGLAASPRAVGLLFGPDVVQRFCKRNKIDVVIRAHQVVKYGYEYFANGHLITVFSATNYVGRHGNAGAMLEIVEINSELHVTPKYILPREQRRPSPAPPSSPFDNVRGRPGGTPAAGMGMGSPDTLDVGRGGIGGIQKEEMKLRADGAQRMGAGARGRGREERDARWRSIDDQKRPPSPMRISRAEDDDR